MASQQNPSGGEIATVDKPAGEELSRRLARQNRAFERHLKDPANDEARKLHEGQRVGRIIPTAKLHGFYGYGTHQSPAVFNGMGDDLWANAIALRLDGKVIRDPIDEENPRPLRFDDLYRAYKHTPHQPASLFLKYMVHRLNNVDAYDDPVTGAKLDQDFLTHHKQGGAAEKNDHVTGYDLHAWMKQHPDLAEQLLAHKAALHAELARGVGLGMRDINGEKYVALTRGLNADIMDHEHALSSWSDLVDPGFGKHKHHAWVPLKDLWYSFQYGPFWTGGDVGHEHEYLVSHTAPRYEAQPHDVLAVNGHGRANFYDNATDAELAEAVRSDPEALNHPNSGPLTAAAFQAHGPAIWGPEFVQVALGHSRHVPREQALSSTIPSSALNPNLTTQDLSTKALMMSQQRLLGEDMGEHILKNPAATADTARTVASQLAGNLGLLAPLAKSPLSPPEVLDQVVQNVTQLDPKANFRALGLSRGIEPTILDVLRNPNHTGDQADALGHAVIAQSPQTDYAAFLNGRYSPAFVQELAADLDKGFGQEPSQKDPQYQSMFFDDPGAKRYQAAVDKFLAAKAAHVARYNALAKLASNRDLPDESVEALIDVAEKHQMNHILKALAIRHKYKAMGEGTQLRLLRAMDENDPGDLYLLGEGKDLSPSAAWALALHHDPETRKAVYHNANVDDAVLEQAWPSDRPFPTERAVLVNYGESPARNPYEELAAAIQDRRDYRARRAEAHLIKPWPMGLAKSEDETNWWPVKLREWMAHRVREEQHGGFYFRAANLDQAQAIVKDKIIPVEPTDEVLDGYVVMAHPAKDHWFHTWEKDSAAGGVLVYFETDSAPTQLDGRVYWPHDLHISSAKIAGIRPRNDGAMKKSEPLTRGPAFNGEKDYRPDESGDPRFPFMGGAHKERSPESDIPELFTHDLDNGEHATALAQLGHNDRYEQVLAAACFLSRGLYDPDAFQQGLAVWGDEERAALHAVGLSDSEKNVRALRGIVQLQRGKAKPLAKSEPEPIGIHSVQPGNEDAVEVAAEVQRAIRAGYVRKLHLNGKHSKGAMSIRDPQTGKVKILKPGSGKQSPAAGARDGSASQSRREAAFWHIADHVHLGGAIPRADLILVNAQEWAVITLLGSNWRSLDERNREKQYKGREVLAPYLASGQIHRWAILDWVLGNTDSHGQNMLVNEGESVALIDHGSAFAGKHFDPAHDTKSFIPFYLRVWAPDADFKKMAPAERIKHMPVLGHYDDQVLRRWLDDEFTPEMVERECRKYGIDPEVVDQVLARLHELRSAPGNLSQTVNALWAGTQSPRKDLLA